MAIRESFSFVRLNQIVSKRLFDRLNGNWLFLDDINKILLNFFQQKCRPSILKFKITHNSNITYLLTNLIKLIQIVLS